MHTVILGAGALGSIFAAHLIEAGETVSIVARGARAAHLREHGLHVSGLKDICVPCEVITEPQTLQEADALIVTVKTYDMAEALAAVQHVAFNSVCSVQNGVLKNEQLAQAFGADKVLGATCLLGGEVLAGGETRFTLNAQLFLGELPGGQAQLARQLVEVFQNAGLSASYSAYIESMEWTKFVGWSGVTALAVLTRLETPKLLCDPDTARLVARVMRETAQLAKQAGIALEDQPPMLSATVADSTEDEAVEKLQALGAELQARAPHMRQSALQDVLRGRPLEVEETFGYTVQQAAARGLAVPTVDVCYRVMAGLSRFQG